MTWMIEQYVLMGFWNWNSELGSMSGRLISERDWSFFLQAARTFMNKVQRVTQQARQQEQRFPQPCSCWQPFASTATLTSLSSSTPASFSPWRVCILNVRWYTGYPPPAKHYMSTSPYSHTKIHHWEANVHLHMISGMIWYDNNQALNKKITGRILEVLP